MNRHRWETIRRLFDAALPLAPAARAAFLAECCGRDATLRAEVEALLAAERAAGDGRFLRDAVRTAARRVAGMRESGPDRR